MMLSELTDARDRMLAGETYLPRVRVERCHVVERKLIGHFDVIDTITAQDFLSFHTKLAPASYFQSVQFREIEFLSGLKDPDFLHRFRRLPAAERERLERRLAEPSLWDGFLSVLAVAGFDVSEAEARFAAYARIGADRERFGPLWDLAEALVAHDQAFSLWRARLVLMAERQLGTKPGTGGSGRACLPAFPGGDALLSGALRAAQPAVTRPGHPGDPIHRRSSTDCRPPTVHIGRPVAAANTANPGRRVGKVAA